MWNSWILQLIWTRIWIQGFFLDFWCNMKAYSIITVAWSVNQKLVFVRTTFSPISPSTTVIKTQQIYSEKDVAV